MKKIFLIGMSLFLTVVSFSQQPTDTNSAPNQEAVAFASITTLQSDFVEEKHIALFAAPLQSKGKFSFDRAAQLLRWQYLFPFKNGFLIDHQTIYRLQKGEKKLLTSPLSKMAASQMLVWLTLDLDTLKKSYHILKKNNVFTFTPLDKSNKMIKQITIWTDAKNIQKVYQVKMEDASGDFTLWKFDKIQINVPLPRGEKL